MENKNTEHGENVDSNLTVVNMVNQSAVNLCLLKISFPQYYLFREASNPWHYWTPSCHGSASSLFHRLMKVFFSSRQKCDF